MNSNAHEEEILAKVHTEVEGRFAGVVDLAHGWEHVDRVYRLALNIAKHEGGKRFVVGAAALMHDLGRSAEDAHRHHADISVELAREILEGYGVGKQQQERIVHAILAHSFSLRKEPETVEARIVRDADRLDALGAIGILRWAIVSGQRSTRQTRLYDVDDPMAERHAPDDHTYFLDHFFVKLLKLEETMTTDTGRRLARQRSEFMRTYLQAFKGELDEL
jgi:uncharacterized protein